MIDLMANVKQVEGNLPSAFREKYPSTYCTIDGNEIRIYGSIIRPSHAVIYVEQL